MHPRLALFASSLFLLSCQVGREATAPASVSQPSVASAPAQVPRSEPLPSAPVALEPVEVDFDAALDGLNFALETTDFNVGPSMAGNGLLDADEMALVAAVLADPSLDLSAHGGVRHADVRAAHEQALAASLEDTRALVKVYPTATVAIAGYALLGDGSFQAMAAMSAAFQAPLVSDYTLARALTPFFAAEGDADGDGATNLAEYEGTLELGREAFLAAALDPGVQPAARAGTQVYWCPMRGRPCDPLDHDAAGKCPSCGMDLVRRSVYEASATKLAVETRRVGIVLYPGFEVLDVYGPVEMWGNVPEFELVFVAEQAGPVLSAQGAQTVASHSFADAPELDLLMVPGGLGTMTQLGNHVLLDFLRTRAAEAELTTSVCTGSVLLAAAGVLDERRATSNKLYFSMAEQTSSKVAWVREARWVDDGDVITSSGVSAGMDMALHVVERLLGKARADEVARWAEYVRNTDPSNDPFAPEAR
jgi:putative intracellular protease/amidase